MIEFLTTPIEDVTPIYVLGFCFQGACLGFIIGIHAYERMINKLEEQYQ